MMGDLRIKSQTLAIKGLDMQAGIKNTHATEVQVKQPISNPDKQVNLRHQETLKILKQKVFYQVRNLMNLQTG